MKLVISDPAGEFVSNFLPLGLLPIDPSRINLVYITVRNGKRRKPTLKCLPFSSPLIRAGKNAVSHQ